MLNVNKLYSDLKTLFTSNFTSYDDAAQGWIDAYVNYANDAIAFIVLNPTITDESKTTMKNMLKAYFMAVGSGTPAGASSAIANAITTLWLVPPTVFLDIPLTIVTSVDGTAALIAALTGIFAVLGGTADSKALSIATAIDTFTKTIIVTNTVSGATCTLE